VRATGTKIGCCAKNQVGLPDRSGEARRSGGLANKKWWTQNGYDKAKWGDDWYWNYNTNDWAQYPSAIAAQEYQAAAAAQVRAGALAAVAPLPLDSAGSVGVGM